MKVAFCRANNVQIAEWQEQRCRLKNCQWLVYMCDVEVKTRKGLPYAHTRSIREG